MSFIDQFIGNEEGQDYANTDSSDQNYARSNAGQTFGQALMAAAISGSWQKAAPLIMGSSELARKSYQKSMEQSSERNTKIIDQEWQKHQRENQDWLFDRQKRDAADKDLQEAEDMKAAPAMADEVRVLIAGFPKDDPDAQALGRAMAQQLELDVQRGNIAGIRAAAATASQMTENHRKQKFHDDMEDSAAKAGHYNPDGTVDVPGWLKEVKADEARHNKSDDLTIEGKTLDNEDKRDTIAGDKKMVAEIEANGGNPVVRGGVTYYKDDTTGKVIPRVFTPQERDPKDVATNYDIINKIFTSGNNRVLRSLGQLRTIKDPKEAQGRLESLAREVRPQLQRVLGTAIDAIPDDMLPVILLALSNPTTARKIAAGDQAAIDQLLQTAGGKTQGSVSIGTEANRGPVSEDSDRVKSGVDRMRAAWKGPGAFDESKAIAAVKRQLGING